MQTYYSGPSVFPQENLRNASIGCLPPDERGPEQKVTFRNSVMIGLDNKKSIVAVGFKHSLASAFESSTFQSDDKVFGLLEPKDLDFYLDQLSTEPSLSAKAQSVVCALPGKPIFTLVAPPDSSSRTLHEMRPDLLLNAIKSAVVGEAVIVLVVERKSQILPIVSMVARLFPILTFKSSAQENPSPVKCCLVDSRGEPLTSAVTLSNLLHTLRTAMAYADLPTSAFSTENFVNALNDIRLTKDEGITVVGGDDLRRLGLNGLFNVGKQAEQQPKLVILDSHQNADVKPESTVCFVAKGIMFDTGGLSIKGKEHMPKMKYDMCAAANIAELFHFICREPEFLPENTRLVCLLCLAENAVGPIATRPDDVFRLYGGKTVEVNNTDAEGRLVLADGVAYAAKQYNPNVIVDMATLTGAQAVTTGAIVGAVLARTEGLENMLKEAGKRSGDLVSPIVYAPELALAEFKSEVADFKNSVASRMNMQCSCAGHFIEFNIPEEYTGPWAHIDIAGPAVSGGRATGFGFPLLLDFIQAFSGTSIDDVWGSLNCHDE
ncbi:MAG: hypothetical protein KVP17_004913 [Porospora cf. gigantea B]|uniref:uncharacterized protein n=1 Tax=Porospora cf. gigantea B TaxID=2853592 RepID=UPI003571E8C6|nr:MAG: hypothetical protein KVP17_004913 [Porospora cf. gigantea B]